MSKQPLDPVERDWQRRMRRAEKAIEDHSYDIEDSHPEAKRRMMRAIPEYHCGMPGYLIDEAGKVYRCWRMPGPELLDQPEEVKVSEKGQDRASLGRVILDHPFRNIRKQRSVLALMTQMQHPAAGRFIKVTPLRQRAEAKNDLYVQMSRPEPVPDPEECVRMMPKNLYKRNLWKGLPTHHVNFPNHAIDPHGCVWRVTLPISVGGEVDHRTLPRDELAELLPWQQWTRVAVTASESEYLSPRFIVQLRAKTADKTSKKCDVMKLVHAYHGFDASLTAYKELSLIYDPIATLPRGGGKAVDDRTMARVGVLTVGEKLAAKMDAIRLDDEDDLAAEEGA